MKNIEKRIFIAGVSCIGKTTVAKKLSLLLDTKFYDLDKEIEAFHGTSIEKLQNKCFNMHEYRNEAAEALSHLLSKPKSLNCVIALPPSGLIGGYLKTIKKFGGITIVLEDKPENILKRITFYDIYSREIMMELNDEKKMRYLKVIKEDITYFKKSYKRANYSVDITGLDSNKAALKIKMLLLKSKKDDGSFKEYNRNAQQTIL